MLPLALATELLHTYLLIHDDIMDHAEVRRGLPAAHVRFRDAHRERGFQGDAQDFGLSVAILLGDLAHTWAVELATRAALSNPLRNPLRNQEIARCFAAMSQEVIGGQYLELLVAQRRGAPEEELTRVLRLKSGCYTAERPIQLGAILAGVRAGPPGRAVALRHGDRRGLPAPGRPAGHVRRRRAPWASPWAPTSGKASSRS